MRHSHFSNFPFFQRGFTMLEVVVAIMIVAGMTVLLSNAFSPHLAFKQRMDSEDRLKELLKATESMYTANAFAVDNTDLISLDPDFPNLGQLALENGVTTRTLSTACPAKSIDNINPIRDPGNISLGPVPQVVNLAALQPYTGRGVEDLAKDGFNNVTCVLVSRRTQIMYSGQILYYHVVAFVSPGANNRVESGTELVKTRPNGVDDVWTLNVVGDDKGVVFDGSSIAISNYKTTKARLDRFARAYETYFKIRYQSRFSRDPQFNYFYASTTPGNEVNGEPRVGFGDPAPTPPDTKFSYVEPEYWPRPTKDSLPGWYGDGFDNVIDTGLWRMLGLNDTDLFDAWNNPIIVDNFSPRVRPGVLGGIPQVPPFSAQFGAFLPGVLNNPACQGNIDDPAVACPSYMTSTAFSTY